MAKHTTEWLSEDIHRVFSTTMLAYQERRNSSGCLGACDHQNADQGKASNTFTPALIRPTEIDLACDVELAARSVLSRWEYDYFVEFYASGDLPAYRYHFEEFEVASKEKPSAAYDYASRFAAHISLWHPEARELARRKDEQIRLKLGAEFLRRYIAPIGHYLKPVDSRRNRQVPARAVQMFKPDLIVIPSFGTQLKEAA